MRKSTCHWRSEHGFSFIELLVAVSLVAVLLTGTLVVLGRTRASYEATASSAEWMERAQVALDQLSRDTRAAGFNGCVPLSSNKFAPIQVFAGNSPEVLNLRFESVQSAVGSDVLTLRVPRANTAPITILSPINEQSDPIEINPLEAHVLSVGDTVMLYDCEHRAYARVTKIEDGRIEHDALMIENAGSSKSEQPIFGKDAELVVLDQVTYFVPRSTDDRSPVLWRAVNQHAAPLLKNVERLLVTPGRDEQRDNLATAGAQDVWNESRSVDITIFANEYPKERASEHPSVPKVLTTTVCIRNRCLPESPS